MRRQGQPFRPSEREEERSRMVDQQLRARGISDQAVLEAMRKVPRHRFVPDHLQQYAYADEPLPIGEGQTISQPYVVALMLEALEVRPGDRVLEVGTGSGYVAALLDCMGCEVYTVERVPDLAARAAWRLRELGYRKVEVRCGDGTRGWAEKAPFDAILVSAAAPAVPPSLVAQLRAGGRLVIPVGDRGLQELVRVRKSAQGDTTREYLGAVSFVPLVGAEGWPEPSP